MGRAENKQARREIQALAESCRVDADFYQTNAFAKEYKRVQEVMNELKIIPASELRDDLYVLSLSPTTLQKDDFLKNVKREGFIRYRRIGIAVRNDKASNWMVQEVVNGQRIKDEELTTLTGSGKIRQKAIEDAKPSLQEKTFDYRRVSRPTHEDIKLFEYVRTHRLGDNGPFIADIYRPVGIATSFAIHDSKDNLGLYVGRWPDLPMTNEGRRTPLEVRCANDGNYLLVSQDEDSFRFTIEEMALQSTRARVKLESDLPGHLAEIRDYGPNADKYLQDLMSEVPDFLKLARVQSIIRSGKVENDHPLINGPWIERYDSRDNF